MSVDHCETPCWLMITRKGRRSRSTEPLGRRSMDPCLERRRVTLRRLPHLPRRGGANVCPCCYAKLCNAHQLRFGLWVTRPASLPPPIWQLSFGAVDQYPGARTVINIDKQRVAAVRKLEALGYSFQGGEWVPALPSARKPTQCMVCWCSGPMSSRDAPRAQTKRRNSRGLLTRSRPTRRDAGQRARSRE